MSYKHRHEKGLPLTADYLKSDYENDPVSLLAAEIVIYAISDWRALVKHKAWHDDPPQKNCNFDELRLFFNGEWCAFLMQNFELEPARILQLLEKELEDAKRKGKKK